jgi:ribonuclease HII
MDLFKFDAQFSGCFEKENFILAGTDEVGRGCLAGPVVSATVIFAPNILKNEELLCNFENLKLNDSKRLSKKEREILAKFIEKNALCFAINFIDENTIDKINILNATKLAMKNNIEYIKKKYKIFVDLLIIDGNFKINIDTEQKSIVKGDTKSASIAAASILAKVARDKFMSEMDNIFPEYGFSKNYGYGTKFHLEMLKKYGYSKIHRKSFQPVSKFFDKQIYFDF